ncbi:hypothetical protein Caci_2905 [Catenulispora acidiphila DSM 44928]|uniref:Uncharacterized protein n=1 Tax=Catenulispora acidiphila (strain DSM 44928 / JCM 14897 / NBRC 102108 / NRRL B-24433 / ID139908) TaxID=479433 RepID=C7Q2S2_CATAD|nr:DUF6011 domain-containing protein [Catenulispora acidiphila]ACU71814.1 hypothetical protein Caci_2905 [Catenulispora acidiphila DSM 44928]
MTTTPLPDGYYAVPDPDDPTTTTCWRVKDDSGGALAASPSGAHYGPALYKRDLPKGLRGRERGEWITAWYQTVRHPWDRKVREAIAADPEAAGLRFAEYTHHCCRCNQPLTVPASQAAGLGPDCVEIVRAKAARGAVLADSATARQRAIVDRATRTDLVPAPNGGA